MIEKRLDDIYGDFDAELNAMNYILPLGMYSGEVTTQGALQLSEASTKAYSLLDTGSLFVKAINGALSTTTDVDIDFDKTSKIIDYDGEKIPFCFNYHGNRLLLETEALTKLPRIRAITQKKDVSTMSSDIKLALKQLCYYLYINDINSVYLTIRRISELKRDMVSKNKKTKPHRKVSGINVQGRVLRYAK